MGWIVREMLSNWQSSSEPWSWSGRKRQWLQSSTNVLRDGWLAFKNGNSKKDFKKKHSASPCKQKAVGLEPWFCILSQLTVFPQGIVTAPSEWWISARSRCPDMSGQKSEELHVLNKKQCCWRVEMNLARMSRDGTTSFNEIKCQVRPTHVKSRIIYLFLCHSWPYSRFACICSWCCLPGHYVGREEKNPEGDSGDLRVTMRVGEQNRRKHELCS